MKNMFEPEDPIVHKPPIKLKPAAPLTGVSAFLTPDLFEKVPKFKFPNQLLAICFFFLSLTITIPPPSPILFSYCLLM